MKSNELLIALPLLLTLSSACVAETDVGRAEGAIIDGRVATDSDVGATVATLMDGTLDCTGTLVTPRVVITAAHCLVEDSWEALLPTSKLAVVVGAVDPTMATEEQTYAVSRLWISADFPGDELSDMGLYDEHDIGAIVLARDVTTVTPVPVLDMAEVDFALTERRMLGISGYGVTDRAGRGDNTLLHVGQIPFIERSERELIAGDPGGTDTCDGDSGGPAWLETADGPRLVGVNSRAVDSERLACDTGSVFTLASAYVAAIEEAVGEDVTGDAVEDVTGDGAVDVPPTPRDEPVTPAPGETPPSMAGSSGCSATGGPGVPAAATLALLVGLFITRRRGSRPTAR